MRELGIRMIRLTAVGIVATAVSGTAVAALGEAAETMTRATEGYAAERADDARRAVTSLEDFAAPEAWDGSAKTATADDGSQSVSCCGFRVWDADTELFDDFDGDGYHTYLRVSFDIDTDYSEAEVYADLWLRGPGNEYVLIYETEVFTIRGSSAGDSYEVETELVAGFPPDLYDVLIEVYEAHDHRFVADYGAIDTPALSLLPLEDISFDGGLPPPVVSSSGSGGAGSFSFAGLLLIAALTWIGRRRAGRGLCQ